MATQSVAVQLLNFFDQPLGLGEVAGGFHHPHRLARPRFGAEVFTEAFGVVGDQLIGGIEDVAKAAVVALQFDDLLHAELALEVEHVADLRTTKGVNALVVVAHRHHRSILARKHFEPGVLQLVGVLELVHQHMLETVLVVFSQRLVVTHQLIGAQHQLGKIHHAFALALFFIGLVNLHQHAGVFVTYVYVFGAQAIFFVARNEPGHLLGHITFFVEVHRFDQAFDGRQLVA